MRWWPEDLFCGPADRLDLNLSGLHGQISHANEVISSGSKGEDPAHLEDAAVPNLPQQRDRLEPSEALFNPLPLSLADGVSRVLRRTSIDRAPTRPPEILRHVRCDLQVATLGHEIRSVVALVAAYRYLLRSPNLFQHDQRGIALGRSVGLEHLRVHDQAVAILYQQIPVVTQLRFFPLTFACHLRIRVRLRCVRLVRPTLPAEVHCRIARIVRWNRVLAILALITLRTRPRFQERSVHGEV